MRMKFGVYHPYVSNTEKMKRTTKKRTIQISEAVLSIPVLLEPNLQTYRADKKKRARQNGAVLGRREKVNKLNQFSLRQ